MVGNQAVVAFAEPPETATCDRSASLIGHEVVPVLADPMAIDHYTGAGNGARRTAVGAPPPGTGHRPRPPATAATPPPAAAPKPAAPAGARPKTGNGPAGRAHLGTTDMPLHVDDLLRYAVSIGASDLHLTANMPPTVRLHGALRPMEDVGRIDNNQLRDMIFGILPQTHRERFEAEHELDTSHSIAGVGRFRVNVCLQRRLHRRGPAAHPPRDPRVPHPGTARVDPELHRAAPRPGAGHRADRVGEVDLAGLADRHHQPDQAAAHRDGGGPDRVPARPQALGDLPARGRADTASFSEALRRVLRQDPDVILVGELRDLETIATALTAAETGHLVFATLHTQDAPATIDRIIDVFPPGQQDQIRIQLGSSLQGVVTQQLVPTADGDGRCVAAEVLVCTSAIQNLIRGAKTHQIYSLMQTGGQHGMQTMDQSLATLVKQRVITQGVAMDRCRSEEDFRNHLHGL